MNDAEKLQEQRKELDLVASRIFHILEHSTQDENIVIGTIFELFLQGTHNFTEEEFELSLQTITRIRKERRSQERGDR